jgi:hypothetical protein
LKLAEASNHLYWTQLGRDPDCAGWKVTQIPIPTANRSLQTLVESSSYFGTQGIRDCIRGIFFFGTPHQGLRTVELEEMLDGADGESDTGLKVRNLLAQLREGSEFLENQKEALSRMWENFHGKVFTFYETEKTKAVKKVNFPIRLPTKFNTDLNSSGQG